jgi:IPT/TIG domain
LSSAQVSIIGFTPTNGLVGAPVIINGTGFSATTSQDTVSFNGVSATITSATATQIVTAVPAGATTGPITVTAPAGPATSTNNFTVTASSGAPTITGFTPPSGVAGSVVAGSGAAVTITGTNFNSTLANNKITFNTTHADTATATSIQLTTTVPSSVSSGHISVATPNGNAVSSQDFFIPFGFHVAADIGYTGRTTLGGSATITLSQASKIGLLLFDASAGQHVSLQLSGSTFSTCAMYIIDPKGNALVSSNCTSATTAVNNTALPTTGTYSIGVDPGAATGSVTVSLVPDLSGTITIDGPPVTVTTVFGQDARLSFTATAGQRIAVYVTNTTYSSSALLYLVKPDGSSQALLGYLYLNQFVDTQTLTTGGTYQLWVHDPGGAGSVTLQIISVPPDAIGGPLTIPSAGAAGPTATVTTTNAGQHASFTFSGVVGQKLSFNVISTSYTACTATVYDPTNNFVTWFYCNAVGTSLPTIVTVGTTGTYTLFIDALQYTGSLTMSINNDSDATGTIAIDGPSVTATTTVAGQDARLSFTATAGQKVMVYATNVTYACGIVNLSVHLVKPDGTDQAYLGINNNGAGQTFFLDTQMLATSGTYQLWVPHVSTCVGSETFQVVSAPPDVTGTIAIDGAAVTTPTTVVGQDVRLNFTATAGQRIVVYATNVSNDATLNLVNPGGATQAQERIASFDTADFPALDTQVLATSGTYQLWVRHSSTNVGSETLQIVSVPPDVTGTIAIDGSAVTATTTAAGQDARLSFTATAGQRIVVYVTNVTNPAASVVVLEPDGTSLETFSCYPWICASVNIQGPPGQTFYMDTMTLATTGTYQLWMRHVAGSFGSATFQIASVPVDFAGTVTIGGAAIRVPATGNTAVGQNATVSFNATAGEQVTINVTNPTFGTYYGSCNLLLAYPSGYTEIYSCGVGSPATIGPVSWATAGTYTISIDPQGMATGSVTISVVTP